MRDGNGDPALRLKQLTEQTKTLAPGDRALVIGAILARR